MDIQNIKTPSSKWFYFSLFLLSVFFTNMRQNVVTNFDCEICSDKAGYYSYLPSLFYYNFKASNYPEKSDSLRGFGFHLNLENDKVVTKFPVGLAIMQLPFYATGYIIDKIFSLKNAPFSKYYLVWMSIGSSFYLILSLFLYRKVLQRLFSDKIAFITSLILLLSTHVLYYSLDENLMSHLYSFVLLIGLIYSSFRLIESQNTNFITALSTLFTLAILVRPTNFLFLPMVYFLSAIVFPNKIIPTIKSLGFRSYLLAIVTGIMVSIPQIIYWKYAYNKWVVWTYEGEGFTNASTPYFLEVWFSPQGGLFTYTPILLVALLSSIIYFNKNRNISILVFSTFLIVSYLCASWHTPFFGECNFGKRPFVEFLPILLIPIALLLENVNNNSVLKRLVFSSLVLFSILNLTMFGAFDTCFFGDIWDWDTFFDEIIHPF